MPGERRDRGFERAGWIPPRHLGVSVERARELLLARAWSQLAGSTVSARSRVELRRGVLEIEVPDPRWRAALLPLAGGLAARIAAEFPELGVQRYRLRPAPGEALSPPESLPPRDGAAAIVSPPHDETPHDETPRVVPARDTAVEHANSVERLARIRDAYLVAAARAGHENEDR